MPQFEPMLRVRRFEPILRVLGVIVTIGFIVMPVVSTIEIATSVPSVDQLSLVILHGFIASCFAFALLLSAVLATLKVPQDSRVLWMAALIAALNYTPAAWFLLR